MFKAFCGLVQGMFSTSFFIAYFYASQAQHLPRRLAYLCPHWCFSPEPPFPPSEFAGCLLARRDPFIHQGQFIRKLYSNCYFHSELTTFLYLCGILISVYFNYHYRFQINIVNAHVFSLLLKK